MGSELYKSKSHKNKSRRKFGNVQIGILSAVLLLSVFLAVVWALYLKNSYVVENRFGTNSVSCTVEEDFANNIKSRIQVENTSTVDAYIRVRLVSYWQTPSGSIAGRTSDTPVAGIDFQLADGWVADLANNTYYYVQPVKAGEKTPDLFADGSSMTLVVDSEGYIQVVEVLAEAIQANPTKAVEEAWNVTMSDQTINGIK